MCQCHDPVYLDIERLAVNYMISRKANYDIYMHYSERPPSDSRFYLCITIERPFLTPAYICQCMTLLTLVLLFGVSF